MRYQPASESVALFFYHKLCHAAEYYFKLLQSNNDFPVVPIFCLQKDSNTSNLLPGSVQLQGTFKQGTNWHNQDWLLADWFRSPHSIIASRYFNIEWDCHVSVPLHDLYSDVLEADLVCHHEPDFEPSWAWTSQRDLLDPELARHARAIAPMNGLMLSLKTLALWSR